MHPHTAREVSILRQMRGSLGTRMISSTKYFQLLISTIIKDGGVSEKDMAKTLDCPTFLIENWVSGNDLPTLEESQRLAEKLVKILDQELKPEFLIA